MTRSRLRSLIELSWPILIAQLAIMANGVADTIMVGHYRTADLAAISIGTSVYISVYIGLMGVLQALVPLAAHDFGAGRFKKIGRNVRQTVWVALGLSIIGMLLMLFPGPFMRLANAPQEVDMLTRGYLQQLAWGLPGALLARVFYAFSPAVGYSKPVMIINLTALGLKVPLSYLLLYGALGVPEFGVRGCGISSSCAAWAMAVMALFLAIRTPAYRPFELFSHFEWPQWKRLKPIFLLGIPIGLSLIVEVTSFTFIALFLARLSAQVSGGHQILASLTGVLYMVPLSLANGTSVLVGQALGQGKPREARNAALLGISVAGLLSLVLGLLVMLLRDQLIDLYTNDPVVADIARQLMVLMVIYHFVDALQIVTIFSLRGYKKTAVPTLIYAAALWGVGLGMGYTLAFKGIEIPCFHLNSPLGPAGFWVAAIVSVILVVMSQFGYFHFVSKRAIANQKKAS